MNPTMYRLEANTQVIYNGAYATVAVLLYKCLTSPNFNGIKLCYTNSQGEPRVLRKNSKPQ